MRDLLPCPFCGSSAAIAQVTNIYQITCSACGAGTRLTKTAEEANALWNRRPNDNRLCIDCAWCMKGQSEKLYFCSNPDLAGGWFDANEIACTFFVEKKCRSHHERE